MSDLAVQASFNSGEWAPSLFARVDIVKWKSGAALLQNFFVDYRGGASSRPGTVYVIQVKNSSHPVRLISFQPAFNIGYCLEFGQNYLRFMFEGAPVVENPFAITGATQASPCVLDIPGNNYAIGDWIFISGIVGMTQLNGRYFIVSNVSGANVTITGLDGGATNSTGFGAYISGGTASRIYTINTPYLGSELALLKFAQADNVMILCHPNHPMYSLEIISATDWVLAPITIGSTASPPTIVNIATTLPVVDAYTTPPTVGQANYSYVASSIDASGQESGISNIGQLGPVVDIRVYNGTNQITLSPVAGAVAYNYYESNISYFGVQPSGIQYGFIGVSTGTQFIDDDIIPDFSQTPQVPMNPFVGSGVSFYTVTAAGTYTTVPAVTLTGGSPTTPASAIAQLQVQGTPTIGGTMTGYAVGDIVNFGFGLYISVTGVSAGAITSVSVSAPGGITSGSTPTNPLAQVSTSGNGTGATASATWGVGQIIPVTIGAGYVTAPTVSFSSGSATATATLSPTGNGNPTVPGFFDQRLVVAASLGSPETFWMSQPGSYYNFNVTDPVQPTNAITGTLVSGTTNTIKAIVSVPAGMLMLTDKAAWVVNGGNGVGSAISPTAILALPQSFIGANDVPPIIANYDILFVQSKGSAIRDLSYNIYFNVFTGNDISEISSHLFYGFTVTEWAWAEQPFYVVWAVRNDGVMLTLTYLKEQEFVGWSHSVTAGSFKSVAAVTEVTSDAGTVDAVYTVVQRSVNSNSVQYIERVSDRIYPNGLSSAISVDSSVQYTGSATLAFQGAEHLASLTVTGLATDNLGNVTVIAPFTMPVSGEFTLPAPTPPGATGYTVVTIGLAYTYQLQTLPLDIQGESIQGKVKKIPHVDVRVNQTLNLSIGSDFSHLVPMKDLVQGNVSSMLTGQASQVVSGLYTGDARTFLDPTYTVPGQYCIQGASPYPASILGLFPAFVVGDER